jgi:hypothetical protein
MLTMIEGCFATILVAQWVICTGEAQSTIGATGSGCLRPQCFWYTKAEPSGYVG